MYLLCFSCGFQHNILSVLVISAKIRTRFYMEYIQGVPYCLRPMSSVKDYGTPCSFDVTKKQKQKKTKYKVKNRTPLIPNFEPIPSLLILLVPLRVRFRLRRTSDTSTLTTRRRFLGNLARAWK